MAHFFDYWDVSTYDSDLQRVLVNYQEEIVGYYAREREIFRTYDTANGKDRQHFRPENEWAYGYGVAEEEVAIILRTKTMRGFHYCRLTDGEVADMQSNGIVLSGNEFLRARLSGAVADGHLTNEDAERLFESSPLQHGQNESRSGKFWMASPPQRVEDRGVIQLLRNWGGEVVYMFVLEDASEATLLRSIGRPRIIEVAAPLSACASGLPYARRVMTTFAHSMGHPTWDEGIDFWSESPLPPSVILAIHTEGEPMFGAMAQGYPPTYVDRNIALEALGAF